ncbi:MAG TPA: type II toxin-antitoxin system Phd/YefM family antitoxin [Promineifilum sp.]|nr:type II toxin-antitoxin system Phd/YefM family antitoxin [Promineifilum sp.]HRQ14952.1 type II toxin-antitoxin system Phd/YefM family antitoxin [Promineifilum sp.]
MQKTVSATEAKAKLSDLMKWAVKTGDSVVVQSHGYPQVVIVPFTEYQELRRAKENIRRAEVITQLQELARETQAVNQDLSAEEAETIAEEISRAAIEQLDAKGRISFERQTKA